MGNLLKRMIRVSLGAFMLLSLCMTVLAKQTATDGLTWAKGYPMWPQIPGKAGFFWVSAAGTVDTTKYPNIKLDSAVVTMEVTQVDKDLKDIPGTKHTFLNNTGGDTNKGTWSINSQKEWKDGKQVDFGGFPLGSYRVKVLCKVKETANAQQRDAYIEWVGPIPMPSGCGDESQAITLSHNPRRSRKSSRIRHKPRRSPYLTGEHLAGARTSWYCGNLG